MHDTQNNRKADNITSPRDDAWGVILTGGEAPGAESVRDLLGRAERFVAADSGLDLAFEYRIVPDLAVGDMDSLSDSRLLETLAPGQVRIFPHDKDDTDTEIAISTLVNEGFGRIALIGGGGGRLDHLFAIRELFEREVSPTLWVTRTDFVFQVRSEVHIRNCPGETISFFPIGCGPCRSRSSGLKWELDSLEWMPGDFGVSNTISKSDMHVEVTSGRLIMVGNLELLPGVVLE